MHTSVAVFLAFTVIYFGSLVLPPDISAKLVGSTTQAVAVTGAVATFLTLSSLKMGVGHASAALAAFTVVTVLAAMAVVTCQQQPTCQQRLPVHTLVFSTGFMSGAAAYIGFLAGSAVGLPLWAVLVMSIVSAPVFIGVIMPFAARGVVALLDRTE